MKFILGKPENYCSQRNNKYSKTMKGNLGTSKMEASCMCNVTVLSDCITSFDKTKIPELLEYYESKGAKISILEKGI